MSRDMTTAMSDALQETSVRPVLIGRFDIVSDPVYVWTGPGIFGPSGSGDSAMDGQNFDPLAPFVEISNIAEDQGIGGPVTITLSGQDLDETALRQVVRDKRQWRAQKAYLWSGLLDTDNYTVISYPVRIKSGIMTNMRVNRGAEESTVSVTLDRDRGGAISAPFRWIDHPRIYPSDKWGTFLPKLSNNPEGLTFFNTNIPGDTRPNPRGLNIL